MIHERERLPLGLKPGDYLLGVHSGFDDLDRHLTPNWSGLLCQPDLTHAAFADPLQQSVRADQLSGTSWRCGRSRHIGIAGRNRIARVAGHRTLPDSGERGELYAVGRPAGSDWGYGATSLPHSRHLPLASTEGRLTTNLNKTGVRVWTLNADACARNASSRTCDRIPYEKIGSDPANSHW
jgi:hypothetical protein